MARLVRSMNFQSEFANNIDEYSYLSICYKHALGCSAGRYPCISAATEVGGVNTVVRASRGLCMDASQPSNEKLQRRS